MSEEIVIAGNSEEAFWTNLQKESNKRIEQMRHEIMINEAIIELANKKIDEVKNGE